MKPGRGSRHKELSIDYLVTISVVRHRLDVRYGHHDLARHETILTRRCLPLPSEAYVYQHPRLDRGIGAAELDHHLLVLDLLNLAFHRVGLQIENQHQSGQAGDDALEVRSLGFELDFERVEIGRDLEEVFAEALGGLADLAFAAHDVSING